MNDPQEQAGQETPITQSQTAEEPSAPDRAEEKKVDVPQNETPVAETTPEATPTDAGTPTGDTSPGGTAGGTTNP